MADRDGTISLADVERMQAARHGFLAFTPHLEKLYRGEVASESRKTAGINWTIGFCLYNSFLVSDYIVLPNDFMMSAAFHLLASPIYLAMLLSLINNIRYIDIMKCCGPFFLLIVELLQLNIGSGNDRFYYLSGLSIVPMFFYVLFRPAFRYAVFFSLLEFSVCSAFVIWSDFLNDNGKIVTALFGACGGVITVLTICSMEAASRRAFLLGLRVRLLNRELEAMARIDPLTGLGNRRLLDEATIRFWADSSQAPCSASMILIDVDWFKSFNDSYGHSAGDACLATIGRCVAGQTRPEGDIAVRFGGEELVIFLPRTDFEEAWQIAEAVRRAIANEAIPHPVLGKDAVVSASVGVATVSTADCTPAELVVQADKALYQAKHNGRDQVWPPAAVAKAASRAPSTPPKLAADALVRLAS